MANRITNKNVQTHFSCVCGRNVVDHDSFPIRWKDFPKAGIVRRVCKASGQPFLLMRTQTVECQCED